MYLPNSVEMWDSFWRNELPGSSMVDPIYRRLVYFQIFNSLLNSVSLKNQEILELGCGTGKNSLYLACRHNARSVTLIDFSKQILTKIDTRIFQCQVVKKQQDILLFEPKKRYDFVHSAGLIEHFVGKQRCEIVGCHADCVKQDGLVMILVPVKSWVMNIVGQFNRLLGIKEVLFTERKLKKLCIQNGLDVIVEKHAAFGALYGILAQKLN